jgi:ElaB/YqjD/DUF883 family membrane-anchored ribosome-binding protein
MTKTHSSEQIHEALTLLDSVAVAEQAKLQDMISDGYVSLKRFVQEAGNGAHQTVDGVLTTGKKTARSLTSGVNHHVHSNAWRYIGGGMVVGLAVGFLAMRRWR